MREHIVLNQMRLFINISFGGQIEEYSKQSEMTWEFGIFKIQLEHRISFERKFKIIS